MKALVTGGAGFIGSHLVDRLLEKGYQVKIIDNLSTGKEENLNPEADFHNLDICEFDKIKPLFKDIDYVFHLAAIPRVPISIEDPIRTSRVNILGAVNVFKASSDNKVKRVVFASSSSVYGKQEKLPFEESMDSNPISPYGLQKWIGERWAGMFTDLYQTPIVSLRYFNVYGPRLDLNSDYSLVLGKFLKQKKEGRPLTIFGDGEQSRGFTYITDIIKATVKAAESEKIKGGEVINTGSENSQTVNYLAELIGGEVEYLKPRLGDPRHTKADISLAKDLLDWQPEVGFEEGVKKTIKWFSNK